MIIRAASGWQTATADLALILFLITAQAVREEQPAPAVAVENEASAPVASSALALHRPAQGESVRKWLLATVTDERQVATVTVSYTREQRARALAEGERLLEEAENAGVAARLVATPDARDDIVIAVDYLRENEDGTNLAR
jgi:hypothetical protein